MRPRTPFTPEEFDRLEAELRRMGAAVRPCELRVYRRTVVEQKTPEQVAAEQGITTKSVAEWKSRAAAAIRRYRDAVAQVEVARYDREALESDVDGIHAGVKNRSLRHSDPESYVSPDWSDGSLRSPWPGRGDTERVCGRAWERRMNAAQGES